MEEVEINEQEEQPTEEIGGNSLILVKDVLSPRQRKLCELAAQGYSNRKIAQTLGYTDSRVSILLGNIKIQEEVNRVREKIYQDGIGKRIKELGALAADELEKCLTDTSNRYKESIKVDVAKFIVEKIDGKAVQKHDIGENMLSVMMDRLDSLKSAGQTEIPAIEVEALPAAEADIPAEEVQPRSKSEEDLLRDWVINYESGKKL